MARKDFLSSSLSSLNSKKGEDVLSHAAVTLTSHDDDSDDKNDECDESVHSIERIMCPRAASFGQTNKKRGGRWDTNLMEDSMPGLVSFSHGSFASEFNASSVDDDDHDSVSSLECSLIHSGHSRQQAPNNNTTNSNTSNTKTTKTNTATLGRAAAAAVDKPPGYYSRRERSQDLNVLQPLARMEPDCKQQHQEVRWGGGSLHRSSDTLPSLVRRQN